MAGLLFCTLPGVPLRTSTQKLRSALRDIARGGRLLARAAWLLHALLRAYEGRERGMCCEAVRGEGAGASLGVVGPACDGINQHASTTPANWLLDLSVLRYERLMSTG